MLTIDLANPPPVNPQWLLGFTRCFSRLEPQVVAIGALEHALLAHQSAWLLEPAEAAELWVSALRSHGWLA